MLVFDLALDDGLVVQIPLLLVQLPIGIHLVLNYDFDDGEVGLVGNVRMAKGLLLHLGICTLLEHVCVRGLF